MSRRLSENRLVQRPAIQLLSRLEWESINGYDETYGEAGTLGRGARSEVILTKFLRPALEHLNPGTPSEALTLAEEQLVKDRSRLDPVRANQEVYQLLKDGVRTTIRDEDGEETVETVRVIDWNDITANNFLLVHEFWVTGEMYTRRADLVGFVNGIPLVLFELKASHVKLENAFKGNLRDYKSSIPQLFWYNGLIVLSNGSESVVGSMSAEWGHFAEWKRINSEGEVGVVSLDTMIRGTCEPSRLLDLVENFTCFLEERGGLIKFLAKNHQYLGVQNAIDALRSLDESDGQLGVFWHTQGSGKSISMLFFSQKVLRKQPGNWTFVVITDRQSLDDQIYKTFQAVGAVAEGHVQAESGDHLKELLTEDHRYVFTLIHKFHTEQGETYPQLSDRSDIIVMTDEAHRTQYDILALNMRNALPNASYIGFTGTPLMAGEERTREVFGEYVSIYDFQQSIEDGATVPLYYENRVPELQIIDDEFDEKMEAIIETAELGESQERRLSKEFGREYHLITRDERLDRIAKDIVEHFMSRGYRGKAMVISIDKATAVRMHDKVEEAWQARVESLRARLKDAEGEDREALQAQIDYMEATDRAVVVSQSQNEVADLAEKGANIVPHRRRMNEEDLETQFKDPNDPLRLVFVCAMWITGFDVPPCSTIYLDKPMRNHTLMQTIARANRVFRDKNNGLIVDYIGIFKNLEKALAIYTPREGGDEKPIRPKEELVAELEEAIAKAKSFCEDQGVSVDGLVDANGFDYIRQRDDAVDLLVVTDEIRGEFLRHANYVNRLFKAILPDSRANSFGPVRAVLRNLADKIRSLSPTADISEVLQDVERLLDASVAPKPYKIQAAEEEDLADKPIDLSEIDFEALTERFEKGRKRTEIQKLRAAIEKRMETMLLKNPTRKEYLERFQQLIDEYNRGHESEQEIWQRLMQFAKALDEEEERNIAEGLSEEELTLFDLLTKPEIELTKEERSQVKEVARELLDRLKQEKLVLDWRKKQEARAGVQLTIQTILDDLPDTYSTEIYEDKCARVYQHIYDSYFGDGDNIYTTAA